MLSEVVPRLVPGWNVDTFFGFQLIISCFAAWGVTQLISQERRAGPRPASRSDGWPSPT